MRLKHVVYAFRTLCGCLLALLAFAGLSYGVTPAVPEIDGGVMGSAVALLIGGYLILLSRTGRKLEKRDTANE